MRHQALVCTHTDGHNRSGNIHVHIVINNYLVYLKQSPMDLCTMENLHQVDFPTKAERKVTEKIRGTQPENDFRRHHTSHYRIPDTEGISSCLPSTSSAIPAVSSSHWTTQPPTEKTMSRLMAFCPIALFMWWMLRTVHRCSLTISIRGRNCHRTSLAALIPVSSPM